MSEGGESFTVRLSAALARSWAESMADCLRGLPDGDSRRDKMVVRVRAALKMNELFCVRHDHGAAVMAPTVYARGLLIEARSWQ